MSLGKTVSRVVNTASDLVLGTLHSKPVQGALSKMFKLAGDSVEPAAGIADKTINGVKAVGKAAVNKETYQKVGQAVQSGVGKTTKTILTDPDSYKKTGQAPGMKIPFTNISNKDTGKGTPILMSNKSLFADDMNRRIKTGLDGIAALSKPLVKGGGDNLLPFGMKATGLGVAAATVAQIGAGTPEAIKSWNQGRQGMNYDNQPVTSAPRTPAYAQNGGATGDLVFALNNLRHGGMM